MCWNRDKVFSVVEVLIECENCLYELENCHKGSRTDCHTYKELGEYLNRLSENMKFCADNLMIEKEND